MTKEDIFNYFLTNSANLGVKGIVFTMLGGLVIAAIIYLTYWITNKGVQYNSKFNTSLAVILMISIVIMLMISSNIVISLGMVGALSIVRFRTAIKDSRDTVYIFWAIAEGLSVGSGNFKLALITTVFVAIILMATSYIPKIWHKYLIIIAGEGKTDIDVLKLIETMKPFILDSKLRASNKDDNHQEIIFEVRTKGELDGNIISKIKSVKGVKSVNYVIESGETVG